MTAALLYTVGIVAFFAAILASIGLHELGHLIPAKRFGGKVTQYFIGFGPTLWSRQRGETEVGIKAIPLGGYVKIIGMLPPGPKGEQRDSNTGMFTQLIHDARKAEWDLVTPEDEGRLFYKLPWWKKVIVMAGGPTVNILIAFVCYLLIFGAYGVREQVPNAGRPVMAEVTQCVVPYAEQRTDCRASDPKSPAAIAGLLPGDEITSFNGSPVTSWADLKAAVRANADGAATIGFLRDGQAMTARTNTTVEARPTSETDETLRQVGFLGVTPASHIRVTHGGPIFTIKQMWGMTKASVTSFVHLPSKVWGVAKAIVGVEPRAVDSPVSIVGGGRMAGETVAEKGFPLVDKLVFLLTLVGGFNLFIGLFNFIPLLPLDGGHIASALWEGVRRGFARLARRPDPGFVDAAKLLPIAYVVAAGMLVMGVVLIVGDLVVPVHLPAE
ncbi:M50 family metallopeptidase [Nocardioides sp. Kera G14]|uniref:M50 family metallopeptidase n=1 Tax=Nocardioides sp. Kera G14 TaxID=2884264 RepID=UPI001D10BB34|nr:site-2 protease family protein [Nocardioides sp. Kera G14]UDY22579.1 site-2 protease family protein [Nocardioides sp. Kera G14]